MKAFRFDKCGLERWYFVCNRCDAKWFSLQQRATCPRCRAIATSTECIISTVAAPGINPTAYGSEEGYFTMKPNWITFRSDLAVLPGGYIFLPFVKGHDDAYQTSS